MNITVISAFRNSHRYVGSYMTRMEAFASLVKAQGDSLRLIIGEGDSRDCTKEMLQEEMAFRPFPCKLIDVHHGGIYYGSVVHPLRFKQLAFVWDKLWQNIPEDTDVVITLEADLVWKPESLLSLVEGLQHAEMVSPMVFNMGGLFYDTWAFVRRGKNFRNNPPYHADLLSAKHYLDMDSVGSLVVMRADVAKLLQWREEDLIVGLCKQADALGYRIKLDTRTKVYHP